eukprot:5507640-Pyramimonas_sp.AAC.1
MILRRCNVAYPSNAQQLQHMTNQLRRIGHVVENSPGNLSQAVRARGIQTFLATPSPNDPSRFHDVAGGLRLGHQGPPAMGAVSPPELSGGRVHAEAPRQQEAYPAGGVDSGTDSDTASSFGEEIREDDPELQGVPEDQRAAHLFWAYERAESRWRQFDNYKPTRRVRQVLERKGARGG